MNDSLFMKLFFISIIASIKCSCEEHEDCIFHPWYAWGTCSGTCGTQTQSRFREFCCPDDVVMPQTMDSCLKFCNMTNAWNPKDDVRPCRVCFHGSLKEEGGDQFCVCNRVFKGDCCQGNIDNTPYVQ